MEARRTSLRQYLEFESPLYNLAFLSNLFLNDVTRLPPNYELRITSSEVFLLSSEGEGVIGLD